MINATPLFKYHSSKGAAVIITMFALLMMSSLMILSSSKSIKANTSIIRNQLFEEKAFEASEAGIEYGIAYLKENSTTILIDSDNDGFIDTYTPSAITDVSNNNNTHFSITYSNPTINNFDIIQISVTGSSDRRKIFRNISQLLVKVSLISNSPPAGFISKSNISLSGNASIDNTVTPTTIWTGGSVSLSGSASTNCGVDCGSDRNDTNSDIVENSAPLAGLSDNDFFENAMGVSKTTMENSADLILSYNRNKDLSTKLGRESNFGKAIWVNQNSGTASISGNTTIGSQAKPVILIINGNFKANGNTTIYGVVYVTQDWDNSGGGNLTVYGAVIVEGSYSGTGTPNIIYDSVVIENTKSIADFVKVPGAWSDF